MRMRAFSYLKDNWLPLLYLGGIFLWSLNQLREFDAWYHLKTGEYILKNLTIPRHDIFSYTATGAEWVTHSWLAEIFFYFVYSVGGLATLLGIVALFSAITYCLVLALAKRFGANTYVILFLLFTLPFFRVFPLWIPRPQIFSYFFIILEILLIEQYLKTKSRKYLFFAPVIFLFWANIHASVVLGLLVLLGYVFFDKKIIFPALASVALSFLNPNTYKIFTYQFEIREVAKSLQVREWFSILVYWNNPGTILFFGILALANLFFFWVYFRSRTAENLRLFGLSLGFSLMPFVSARHIAFFPLVVFPILAAKISNLPKAKELMEKISAEKIRVVCILFGIIFILGAFLRMPKELVNAEVLPVRAADFIEANRIKGPLFNMYNEGGYLIWRFWPEEKVFIDGRSEVYRGAPVKDYLSIATLREDWKILVDEKYKINYALFSYRYDAVLTEQVFKIMRAFLDGGFKMVYLDDAHIILLRDTETNKAVIKKFAIDPAELAR